MCCVSISGAAWPRGELWGGVRQQGNVPSPPRRGLAEPAGLRALVGKVSVPQIAAWDSSFGSLQPQPQPGGCFARLRSQDCP